MSPETQTAEYNTGGGPDASGRGRVRRRRDRRKRMLAVYCSLSSDREFLRGGVLFDDLRCRFFRCFSSFSCDRERCPTSLSLRRLVVWMLVRRVVSRAAPHAEFEPDPSIPFGLREFAVRAKHGRVEIAAGGSCSRCRRFGGSGIRGLVHPVVGIDV